MTTVYRGYGRLIPYTDVSWQHGYNMPQSRRVLLHLDDGRRVPVEAEEVFFLAALRDVTDIRTRGRRRLRDVRSLGEVLALFPPTLFVRVHRSYVVNADRVAEVRLRPSGRDWEVKMEAPVNRVLPVGRSRLRQLWAAYGED